MTQYNIRTAEAPGGAILNQVAAAVAEEEFGAELREYASSMIASMYSENGVGLAAPQIGDSRRIIVIDVGQSNDDYGVNSLSLINPVIVESSEERVASVERCLSVPTLTVTVDRASTVKVNYRTPDGESVIEDFTGFMSIKVQHEMDHLEGITLLKHASRLKRSRYKRKMKKTIKRILERYNVG